MRAAALNSGYLNGPNNVSGVSPYEAPTYVGDFEFFGRLTRGALNEERPRSGSGPFFIEQELRSLQNAEALRPDEHICITAIVSVDANTLHTSLGRCPR